MENIRILNGWIIHKLVPNVINGDPLRLANSKDALMLYENGILVQKVSWPEDVKPREGQIHYLEKGVWDPRPLMIGQSRFSPAVFRNVTVTTFVSPDCSSEIFSYAVNRHLMKYSLMCMNFRVRLWQIR